MPQRTCVTFLILLYIIQVPVSCPHT